MGKWGVVRSFGKMGYICLKISKWQRRNLFPWFPASMIDKNGIHTSFSAGYFFANGDLLTEHQISCFKFTFLSQIWFPSNLGRLHRVIWVRWVVVYALWSLIHVIVTFVVPLQISIVCGLMVQTPINCGWDTFFPLLFQFQKESAFCNSTMQL